MAVAVLSSTPPASAGILQEVIPAVFRGVIEAIAGKVTAGVEKEALQTAGTFLGRAAVIGAIGSAGVVYFERVDGAILAHAVSDVGEKAATPVVVQTLSEGNWRNELIAIAKGYGTDPGSTRRIVTNLDTARAIDDLATLDKDVSVYVTASFGLMQRLTLVDGIGAALELKPGLILPLSADPLSEPASKYLEKSIDKGQLHFVTSFTRSDADSFRRLAEVAGDRLQSVEELTDASGKLTLPYEKRSLIVFIGHVEQDGFAIRLPDGTLKEKITFDTIDAMAQSGNSSVVHVGCSTFPLSGSSGTIRQVRDTEIGNALDRAVRANSNAELLAAFGSLDAPFVITEKAVAEAARPMELRLDRAAGGSAVSDPKTAISIRVAVSQAPKAWTSLAWIAGIFYAFLGIVVFVADHHGERSVRKSFENAFPTLPNKLIYPRSSLFLARLREVIFWVLAPVVAVVLMPIVLASAFHFAPAGWKSPDDLLVAFWSILLVPHMSVLGLSIAVSNLLIVSFPAICVLILAVFVLQPREFYGYAACVLAFGAAGLLLYRKRDGILRCSDKWLLKASQALTKRLPGLRGPAFTLSKVTPLLLVVVAISLTRW